MKCTYALFGLLCIACTCTAMDKDKKILSYYAANNKSNYILTHIDENKKNHTAELTIPEKDITCKSITNACRLTIAHEHQKMILTQNVCSWTIHALHLFTLLAIPLYTRYASQKKTPELLLASTSEIFFKVLPIFIEIICTTQLSSKLISFIEVLKRNNEEYYNKRSTQLAFFISLLAKEKNITLQQISA